MVHVLHPFLGPSPSRALLCALCSDGADRVGAGPRLVGLAWLRNSQSTGTATQTHAGPPESVLVVSYTDLEDTRSPSPLGCWSVSGQAPPPPWETPLRRARLAPTGAAVEKKPFDGKTESLFCVQPRKEKSLPLAVSHILISEILVCEKLRISEMCM